ncbi:hypothetical protein PI124_g5798 [Phytophthora idaei]|nr:hypothetical protein PI125_g5303 [Phytophthora idaei]KAG3249571.1 hypothetical protein PI124_g5798 [Phytophthora idaei]
MDRVQRHRELVAMKHAKLQTTHEFLLRRSRGLEPGRQYCEEVRFETSRGDYCAVQFAVAHFRGATSVRAVFDAALFQIANVEMSMSEALGNITIREDDDNGDDNVTQLRLVTSTGSAPMAPPLETNSLQFNEFHEATTSGGPNGTATSGFGIIMADFVDEDELYPYRAHERMRKDVTAALLLTRLPKEEHRHIHREGDVRTRCSDDGELVVKTFGFRRTHCQSAKEIVSRARGTLVDFSLVSEQVSFALELVLVENSLVSAYVGISLVLKFEHVRFSLERT